jgi:Protein of unknown function (DUF1579)
MKTVRWVCAAAVLGLVAPPAVRGQEPARPGPEHEVLQKMEGTWDVTMKVMGQEFKGTVTYKMDLGGLWLLSRLESEIGGMKFQGHGMDTYDAAKKKYVGVWVDSTSSTPKLLEGTYDKAKRTLTMVGEGTGPDGKRAKSTAVIEWKDEDTIHSGIYAGDGKEPAFTMVYKRRK